MLQLYFVHTICHNFDMLGPILTILRGVTEHQYSMYINIDWLT
jgi:hypothetical protein